MFVSPCIFVILTTVLRLTSEPLVYAAEAEQSAAIHVEELKAHVYRLASKDFLGRRGVGAARASQHIAAAFEQLKLQPAFDGSYFLSIPYLLADDPTDKNSFLGRNVAAVLPGSDPKLKDEWIVLSAHFDHLGVRDGVMYPGADDNASSVAMLLEVAEQFALRQEKPRRTILFVAFDQEEAGLLGSRHFAAHPPRDLRKLRCFVTADMLGRSMANLMDEYVFALGSESAARLRQLVDEVPYDRGLKVGRLGADLIGTRSDYGPFRDRRIPFLFLSTGQHPDYHQPTDTPEKIDYVRLQRISQWIADLTWRLANDQEAPVWRESTDPDLNEVSTILELLTRVLDHPEVYSLTERQRGHVAQMQRHLAEIVQRGTVTRMERTWLLWASRLMLATVF